MRDRITIGYLIRREMQYSRLNTALCLAVVAVSAGLLTAMAGLTVASVDATRVMMKQMGFNLLITAQDVDPARYQALDFQNADMPEQNVRLLATNSGVMAQHFVGKYQKTISIDGCTVVLTGVLSEVVQRGPEKQAMPTAYDVPAGKVMLGSAAARALKKEPGDTLTILGKPFGVAAVNAETGAIPDDIRIYAPLHEVQALLGCPGRVNAIDALACQCPTNAKDIIVALKQNIEAVLPQVNVHAYRSILLARHEQRGMIDQLAWAAIAIVMLGAAAAIWGLTHLNVSARRHEIGVLRAMGVKDARIAQLFLGKILGYSVVGAVVGCIAGHAAAVGINFTGRPIGIDAILMIAILVAAPVLSMLFGLPPILAHLSKEPIDVLGESQ